MVSIAPQIHIISLHDALPIWRSRRRMERATKTSSSTTRTRSERVDGAGGRELGCSCPTGRSSLYGSVTVNVEPTPTSDRKSTRLNSSHSQISYAVFCLKKKNI